MRLLLVEDEQALREQLSGQLREKGYSVDAVADGEEGLYYGLEYPYDLAIIDIGLPKLSGIELIRKLRTMEIAFPV
ncbi:MAG: response regulator, partial [Sedimenticola sp.]